MGTGVTRVTKAIKQDLDAARCLHTLSEFNGAPTLLSISRETKTKMNRIFVF